MPPDRCPTINLSRTERPRIRPYLACNSGQIKTSKTQTPVTQTVFRIASTAIQVIDNVVSFCTVLSRLVPVATGIATAERRKCALEAQHSKGPGARLLPLLGWCNRLNGGGIRG